MRTKLKITEGIFPMPVLMVATYYTAFMARGWALR